MSEPTEYPPLQRGGSLLLAWRIKDRNVLIVGGGAVAAGRIVAVLEADARVAVVCPSSGLNNEVRYRVEQGQVDWIDRGFDPSDLDGRDMVLTAIDDHELSRDICRMCRDRRLPVNVADVPPECDFYFMSAHRDGPLQVCVSTNGQGPKLASMIRKAVAAALPPRAGDTIERVGKLRQSVRKWDPEFDGVTRRMGWMSGVCETWGWDGLARLRELRDGEEEEEKVMEKMKEWYGRGEVPTVVDIFGAEDVKDTAGNKVIEDLKTIALDAQPPSTPTLTPGPHISLVGAGPGPSDLLTLRAHHLLTTADLVVSDRLIPSSILSLVTGELRIARKTAGRSDPAQDELVTWCLEGLRDHKRVVRLKIGDPFVFGRGGEEVLAFRQHGFEPELVPGVSSAFSAPMRAGVPVTLRGVSDQVIVTTGRGTQGAMPDLPVYARPRTLVVLMAVGRARELQALLEEEKGYPPEVPCVWVQNADCPEERCVRGTVGSLAEVAQKEEVEAPAVLVVGWVVGALDK
ncbi:tetrapyrrole methylase [Jimgerdemannia flammicorona]|uniref:precorrin-2 dehydrogenase n=1 Tax=Jimgerdemannia flammicorona TaxID=994334 RepID=A0A433QCN2_9FUNG|nr:tetrapyrrole methylase [Jimgerdemannia flammicorona]